MKNTFLIFILSIGFMLAISCKTESTKKQETATKFMATDSLALQPNSWIKERVANAEKVLDTSEAGKIVWKAMEAHGGLQRWFENGPLAFRFNYQPLDGSMQRYTYQTIDTWSNKARHQNVTDSSQEFGWTGSKAWKKVSNPEAFPFDMRFWALTPYYFLGQPFILDGEGVQLEKLADKYHKEVAYHAIKVTFADGTGDAPDDYYILYFGKDDYQLSVIRYIVSYPQYFPEGGHLPEKFMELQGMTTVDGITLATGYHTHWLTEDEKAGEHITTITVDSIAFKPEVPNRYFEMPENAVVIE